jgi:hypothetical protein
MFSIITIMCVLEEMTVEVRSAVKAEAKRRR